MFNHDPSDKVQQRELGNLQPPACCAVCGNGTDLNGYTDPGVWIEYYGQVYFCSNCMKQLIEVAGGLIPEEAAHLQEMNEHLAKELSHLKEEHESATSRLADFDRLISAAVNGGYPVSAVVEDPKAQHGPHGEPASDADAGKPEPKKSVKSRGPINASRATGSDGSFPV